MTAALKSNQRGSLTPFLPSFQSLFYITTPLNLTSHPTSSCYSPIPFHTFFYYLNLINLLEQQKLTNMHLNSESFNFQIAQEDLEPNQQEITPQQKKKSASALHFNVEELYKSRDNLHGFSYEIGNLNRTLIRKDVIRHCNKIKLSPNYLVAFDKLEKMVKNRIQKMIKNRKLKQNWSLDDVFILIWVVSKYADYHSYDSIDKLMTLQDWEYISTLIPGTTAQACMFKWLGLRKSNLSENYWSQKQSQLLKTIVRKIGENDWITVSKNLYYESTSTVKIYRCPKQCREHWNCYLNPKLKKGPWSNEEDMLLLKCVVKNNGLKKWAEMVKLFQGRTQNALKNRYTLLLEKSIKSIQTNQEKTQLQIVQDYLQASYLEQFVNNQKPVQKTEIKPKKQRPAKKQKKLKFEGSRKNNLRSSYRRISLKTIESFEQPSERYSKSENNLQVREDQQNFLHQESNLSIIPDHKDEKCSFDNKALQFDFSQLLDSDIDLPETNEVAPIKQIKMIALTQQIFQNIKTSFSLSSSEFIPCRIDENGIEKIDFIF